jgi:hypothetical protein
MAGLDAVPGRVLTLISDKYAKQTWTDQGFAVDPRL